MKKLGKIYMAVVLMFLYVPIFVLIVFSFNETKSRSVFSGFTFDWYEKLFRNEIIISSLVNTIIIAVLASIISTILGTLAAIGINSMKKVPKAVILNVTNMPVINPEIVTGVSLMILFAAVNIPLGFPTLLLAHITFNIPYVVLSVQPKLTQLNRDLYEAALDLGAHPFLAFRKVVFPEIMPGIINGLLLSFTLSLDDFIISFFTTGNGVSNLSIYVYSMARRGINPKINALSTIMFGAVMLLLILINRRSGKDKDKNILMQG